MTPTAQAAAKATDMDTAPITDMAISTSSLKVEKYRTASEALTTASVATNMDKPTRHSIIDAGKVMAAEAAATTTANDTVLPISITTNVTVPPISITTTNNTVLPISVITINDTVPPSYFNNNNRRQRTTNFNKNNKINDTLKSISIIITK